MIAIKNIEMPSCCGKCTFKEFSGNDNFYHCTRIIGHPIIVDREKYLDNCPLVDIITCMDCGYYDEETEICGRNRICKDETDFCSDAERRE